MGLSGLSQSFFENFSDQTDANVGGYGIPDIPTHPQHQLIHRCLRYDNNGFLVRMIKQRIKRIKRIRWWRNYRIKRICWRRNYRLAVAAVSCRRSKLHC